MSQHRQHVWSRSPVEPKDEAQALSRGFTLNDAKLRRMLTIHSLVASNPATAEKEREKEEALWDQIGSGSCGAIFAPRGRSEVIKVAKKENNSLWNDFLMHRKILRSVIKYPELRVKFPHCLGFAQTKEDFFSDKPSLKKLASDFCTVPADVLVSERILPLPEPTRTHLIEKFCPPGLKETAHADEANKDCLVRPYLGARTRNLSNRFFSLRNFKLHIDNMELLHLDLPLIASSMGQALAVVHWDARTDGRDIEFALGSTRTPNMLFHDEPLDINEKKLVGPRSCNLDDFYWRQTQLFCLDFNQVRDITMDEPGVDMAVDAFNANAPYYPRPLGPYDTEKEAWHAFARAYFTMAACILEYEDSQVRGLPVMFLRKIVAIERAKQQSLEGWKVGRYIVAHQGLR